MILLIISPFFTRVISVYAGRNTASITGLLPGPGNPFGSNIEPLFESFECVAR